MKYVISLSLSLFTSAVVHAATYGFSQGNQFYSIPLQGSVTVYCGGGETASYTCFHNVLDPVSYDYFVGPTGVNAQKVTLSCLRQDGSRRDRTEDYLTDASKSTNAFNLWISTPFQRPLLAMGVNKIDFNLLNGTKVVEQGTFSVNVAHGTPRVCPTTHYNSTDPSDCQSQYTVCQRYFEQYDYCR